MPTIEFNKDDLMELLGTELSDSELENKLTEIGVELEDIEDDKVEVETTSDRIDLLGVEGIARSLDTYTNEKGLKKYFITEEGLTLKDKGVEVRPKIVGAVVRNIEMTTPALKSLIQLQEKLHGTFGRDRSKVSIGVHDIKELKFPLKYEEADPDSESFVPLGKDEEMTLREITKKHDKGKSYGSIVSNAGKWPILKDADGKVLSFPPVINGVITEVTEGTTDVFLDVTGTDLEAVEYALNVLVTTLAERNGEIHEVELVKDGERSSFPNLRPKEFEVDKEFVEKTIGIEISEDELEKYLNRMGHNLVDDEGKKVVKVPSFRADILHQVDIVEDVAIGYGYSNIEPELPNVSTIGSKDELESFTDVARELMVGLGYQEIMNPTIRNKKVLKDYMILDSSEDLLEIKEPVSEKYTSVRDSLLPQLLETLSKNTHNKYPQNIFEAADTLKKDDEKPYKASSDKKLGTVSAGKNSDYNSITSELKGFMDGLGTSFSLKESSKKFLIDGRCAEIMVGGKSVGVVGEIHPQVLGNFGIETPVSAFEVNLSKVKELEE